MGKMANKYNKFAETVAVSQEQAKKLLGLGYLFLTAGVDIVFRG